MATTAPFNIVTIGGSVSIGYGGDGEGWPDRLKRAVGHTYGDDIGFVYPEGIYGNTSTDVLERFVGDMLPRKRKGGRTIAILQVGGNDTSQFRLANGTLRDAYKVSPDTFEQNLRDILDESNKLGIELIVQFLTPVNEDATHPTIDSSDQVPARSKSWAKTNAAAALFNERIHIVFDEYVEKGEVYYLDAPKALGPNYVEHLCDDGVHPNREGHRLVYEELVTVLRQMGVELG